MFYRHNPNSLLTQARLDDMYRHIRYNPTFDYQLCWEESHIVAMLLDLGRIKAFERTVKGIGTTLRYFISTAKVFE